MKGILEILNAYNGGKLLLALYLVCLIYLWRYEKSRNQRLLLVWLPLFFLLLFLRFAFLIKELAIIHNPADWRFSIRTDFHQIYTGLCGQLQSCINAGNSQSIAI